MVVPSSERESIELGVVQEVVVPIAQAAVGGVAAGAAGAYLTKRVDGSGETFSPVSARARMVATQSV